MSFNFSEETLPNDVRHVRLTGTFDSNEAMSRGDELLDQVAGPGGKVLFDLAALEYLSSGAVRVVILCAKRLDEVGGTLHIAAPQPRVMSILTIAGFVPAFPVHETIEEALAALGGA